MPSSDVKDNGTDIRLDESCNQLPSIPNLLLPAGAANHRRKRRRISVHCRRMTPAESKVFEDAMFVFLKALVDGEMARRGKPNESQQPNGCELRGVGPVQHVDANR